MKLYLLSFLTTFSTVVSSTTASSAAAIEGGGKKASIVAEKPGLFKAHYGSFPAADHVKPLSRAYQDDSHYRTLSESGVDPVKMVQAKGILEHLSKSSSSGNHHDVNRNLVLNGHLTDAIFDNCDADHAYQHTAYDDPYQPICQCLLDQQTGLVWMECYLNDESCTASGQTNGTDVCHGTYEIFFFRDTDGDLESKASCRICHTDNCIANGIKEVCTEVYFDDISQPTSCNIIEFPEVADDPLTVCDQCNICGLGSTADPYGVEHTCLNGGVSTGCDTDSYAHLHNFEAGSTAGGSGGQPVGGVFGDVCATSDDPGLGLYKQVSYNTGYDALCDCEDLTSGTISCDLHDGDCFANLCTDISELFFFSRENGNYQSKWTINWDKYLWTQTAFDPTTGQALSCSVIEPDPNTGEPTACSNCNICNSPQDGTGISYSCFGKTQDTVCDASDGRAKFNFVLPPPTTKPVVALSPQPTPPPVASPPAPGQPKPNPPAAPSPTPQSNVSNEFQQFQEENSTNTAAIVMGSLFGGMAVALIIVLIVRQRKAAPAPITSAELDAEEPEIVVGDNGTPTYEESGGRTSAVASPVGAGEVSSAAEAEVVGLGANNMDSIASKTSDDGMVDSGFLA